MAIQKLFFITGTDTDVGKTLVSCSILSAAQASGFSTAAVKPVAAGVSTLSGERQNDDVMALSACSSIALTWQEINPVCFDAAVAPHIAAEQCGIKLDAESIAGQCGEVINKRADLTVIEGAGGWKVPLSNQQTMADIAKVLNVPVILVVGMRLGCLNHALLSVQSILADGVPLAGWVANRIDPEMPVYDENLATLRTLIPAPLLAEIPWLGSDNTVGKATRYIDIERFMSA